MATVSHLRASLCGRGGSPRRPLAERPKFAVASACRSATVLAMAEFIHITTERAARRIRRSGIAARSRGRDGGRGVCCMPVLPSYPLTCQWVRELRRWQPGVLVAVQLRLPDAEPVTVGRYGSPPRQVTAAQAVAAVRELDDPRGYEVFVPRRITGGEVRRIRDVPQGVGWRYLPQAHGRRPCGCCAQRGGYKGAELRRWFPHDGPPRPKNELMASLRDAVSVYRGREAGQLRQRLQIDS